MMDGSMETWSPIAKVYHPLTCGSIDGTDDYPHDKGILRALNSRYKPNKQVVGDPLCTIFVGRLNPETAESTLEKIFSEYGNIKRLRLVRDIISGFSKRYAFIEYKSGSAAKRAASRADKMTIDDYVVLVDMECERELKGWIPRRLGGGFGGKKESGQLRFGGKDRPFKKPIALMRDQKVHEYQNSQMSTHRNNNRTSHPTSNTKSLPGNQVTSHYEQLKDDDTVQHRHANDWYARDGRERDRNTLRDVKSTGKKRSYDSRRSPRSRSPSSKRHANDRKYSDSRTPYASQSSDLQMSSNIRRSPVNEKSNDSHRSPKSRQSTDRSTDAIKKISDEKTRSTKAKKRKHEHKHKKHKHKSERRSSE